MGRAALWHALFRRPKRVASRQLETCGNCSYGLVLRSHVQALRKVQEEIGLDGVCTFNEFAVPLVARLAERLGLPGNPPEACDNARDKVGAPHLGVSPPCGRGDDSRGVPVLGLFFGH